MKTKVIKVKWAKLPFEIKGWSEEKDGEIFVDDYRHFGVNENGEDYDSGWMGPGLFFLSEITEGWE